MNVANYISPILQTLQCFHVWKTKDTNPTDTSETEILRAAETPKDRFQRVQMSSLSLVPH